MCISRVLRVAHVCDTCVVWVWCVLTQHVCSVLCVWYMCVVRVQHCVVCGVRVCMFFLSCLGLTGRSPHSLVGDSAPGSPWKVGEELAAPRTGDQVVQRQES